MEELLARIPQLVAARYPLIWVQSPEEDRVERGIAKLAAAQGKLKDSSRDLERLASRPAAPPPPARPRDPIPPAPAPAPRRAIEPGLYETVRSTAVHEEPLASSRVVSRISSGTQLTVVRGVGEWLEVRSKYGNPPGFVRADDAMLVGRAN